MKPNRKFCALPLVLGLVAMFVAIPGFASVSNSEVVGEVTTVIGVANLNQSQGGSEVLKRGAPVRAGDRIETGPSGHVHIRFIDGGMVSVRPLSNLHIQDYRNENATTKGAIKFHLEQGVVRSVTGAWGEQAREQFRLNTPVAAIGIKGTDFVVKANSLTTQAAVISGAIIMSPLEGGCVASLGPCNSEKSALLSADMSGKMLELVQTGGQMPRLVPAVDLEARIDHPFSPRSADRNGGQVLAADKSGVASEGGEKVALNQNLAGSLVENALPDRAAITPAPADDQPLLWIRNAMEWNVQPNSISRRFDAAEAASRRAVIGNFFISLYRDQTTRSTFSPSSSTVSFNLSEASASYSRPGIAYQPVAVSGARLDVDFARSTYATTLGLSGGFGQTQFESSGKINHDGIFQDANSTQAIAGAFSYDGKQAAYQFDKSVAHGKVSGITIWGR